MDGTFGRSGIDLVALRTGMTPPTRGQHLASLGAARLERILYERDELREAEALLGACEPCQSGEHTCCARASIEAYLETYPDLSPIEHPVPSCSCRDCELRIPAAAAETHIPNDVLAELAVATCGELKRKLQGLGARR